MKRVITYGTFDLIHYGHINLLKRAKELGDYLIVALSTDEFNWNSKQKKCYFPYAKREQLLEAIRYVDLVIPEENWEQKKSRRSPTCSSIRWTPLLWATTGPESSTSSSPTATWSTCPAPRKFPPPKSKPI